MFGAAGLHLLHTTCLGACLSWSITGPLSVTTGPQGSSGRHCADQPFVELRRFFDHGQNVIYIHNGLTFWSVLWLYGFRLPQTGMRSFPEIPRKMVRP